MGRNVRISQPVLVSGGAFGFANPDGSFIVDPGDAPVSPISRNSQSPRFLTSQESLSSTTRPATPPVVASYQDYKQKLSRLSVDSTSATSQSQPVNQQQQQQRNNNNQKRSRVDLQRSSTLNSENASKRTSVFRWRRSSVAPSPAYVSAFPGQPRRSSVITISSPVLEYSTSALVNEHRLGPIADEQSYDEDGALPTPETSYSSTRDSSSPESNFTSPGKQSPEISEKPTLHARTSSREHLHGLALSNANDEISQLKAKLKQSEAKRRDLLIEYQQKLDTERRRNLALQKRMNELTESRDANSSQQSQIKELEHQRDILRKALLHLKETKNIEVHEYKERLLRNAITGNDKKTDFRMFDDSPSKTVKSMKSSTSNSSLSSSNQSKDKLAFTFATLNMGISPLLPIENTIDFRKTQHYIKDFFHSVPGSSVPKYSDAAVF